MAVRIHVIPTANFEGNLDGIEIFLAELSDSPSFQMLLDKLFGEVLPNLEAFPSIGLDFFAKTPASIEGSQLHTKIKSIAGSSNYSDGLLNTLNFHSSSFQELGIMAADGENINCAFIEAVN